MSRIRLVFGIVFGMIAIVSSLSFVGSALAVVTDVTVVSAGTPVPRAKVKVTLKNGDTVQGETDASGRIPGGLDVDPQNVAQTEVTTEDGRTRRQPGAWLFSGGGTVLDVETMAPAAGAAGTLGGIAGTGAIDPRNRWRFDAMLSGGGSTGLGGFGARSSGVGLGEGTGDAGSLAGGTLGFTLRAHLPEDLLGVPGLWLFLRYNRHFGRDGVGGEADLHPPFGSPDTSVKLKRTNDVELGMGKSFAVHCEEGGWGRCSYVGVSAGLSLVQQKIVGRTDESGGGGLSNKFSESAFKPTVVLGAWFSVPVADRFSAVVGADFRRIPCMEVSGTTQPFGFEYHYKTEAQWETTGWGGLMYSF